MLWRPGRLDEQPRLWIGVPQAGGDPLAGFRSIELRQDAAFPDLWRVAAAECGLEDGSVYWYWFEVTDTNSYGGAGAASYVTDPTAWTVDRRFIAPSVGQPAAVVRYAGGRLEECDPGGESADWAGDGGEMPADNRHSVIYELPPRWVRRDGSIGVGTFRDVLAQVDAAAAAPGFAHIPGMAAGTAYLAELGINALELLPPADHTDSLGWGYGTANFFAPSFYLGLPEGQASPTANRDLGDLVRGCHRAGVRFFYDAVMAFAHEEPYRYGNFPDFHVQWGAGDPEQGGRNAWGGDLFKYRYAVHGYDPVLGEQSTLYPARGLMLSHIARWIDDFRIDGIRLDSVENIDCYDFLRDLYGYARERWNARGVGRDRQLVVAEAAAMPSSLIEQGCVGGMWNFQFRERVRWAIQGMNAPEDPDFETTIRRLIDCRLVVGGENRQVYSSGDQAVNYVTSHDIGGYRNERLYNFLNNNGIWDTEKRIKLAFVCLMTALGIPMILAGEEFADIQDEYLTGDKEIDPIDYSLLEHDWRRRIFDHLARLVRLRTVSDGLAGDDVSFIHVDFAWGKRVLAWVRGYGTATVVTVANFSDWGSPTSPGAEYVVHNWPAAPPGLSWREVTQDRRVPAEWVGREPLFPWEAKVYALA